MSAARKLPDMSQKIITVRLQIDVRVLGKSKEQSWCKQKKAVLLTWKWIIMRVNENWCYDIIFCSLFDTFSHQCCRWEKWLVKLCKEKSIPVSKGQGQVESSNYWNVERLCILRQSFSLFSDLAMLVTCKFWFCLKEVMTLFQWSYDFFVMLQVLFFEFIWRSISKVK